MSCAQRQLDYHQYFSLCPIRCVPWDTGAALPCGFFGLVSFFPPFSSITCETVTPLISGLTSQTRVKHKRPGTRRFFWPGAPARCAGDPDATEPRSRGRRGCEGAAARGRGPVPLSPGPSSRIRVPAPRPARRLARLRCPARPPGAARSSVVPAPRSRSRSRGGAVRTGRAEPSRAGPGGGRKMANVQLEFQASAGEADPQSRPLLVLGQLHNLHRLPWAQLRGKLQPRVTEEVRPGRGGSAVSPSPSSSPPRPEAAAPAQGSGGGEGGGGGEISAAPAPPFPPPHPPPPRGPSRRPRLPAPAPSGLVVRGRRGLARPAAACAAPGLLRRGGPAGREGACRPRLRGAGLEAQSRRVLPRETPSEWPPKGKIKG